MANGRISAAFTPQTKWTVKRLHRVRRCGFPNMKFEKNLPRLRILMATKMRDRAVQLVWGLGHGRRDFSFADIKVAAA